MVPVYAKPNASKRRKRPGAKPGHPGARRGKPTRIDRRVEHRLKRCPHCHGPLQRCNRKRRRIIEDSGEAVGYLMPTADTFCMNLHLAEIRRSVPADVHVVLVLDGAGWHTSKGLQVPGNITLLPLPPYSPELNPMEPAWLYLKSHYLANRVYEDHEALYEAGIEAWNRFTADRAMVRSVCHAAWAQSAQSN